MGRIGKARATILFDTGATRNLVSLGTAHAADLHITQGDPIHLGIADNSVLTIRDRVTAPLFLGGEGPWVLDAIVAPKLVYDVILGTPFMYTYQVFLQCFPRLRAHILSPNERYVVVAMAPAMWPPPLDEQLVSIQAEDGYFARETPDEVLTRIRAEADATYRDVYEGIGRMPHGKLREVLTRFACLFPDKLIPCIPPDRGVRNHRIWIRPGAKLPQLPSFNPSKKKMDILGEKLTRMQLDKVIVPNYGSSPCCSPAFIVGPDTKPRLVGDFRALNVATEERAQDVPSCQSVLDLLGEARIFTCSDMQQGYFQLRIDAASQPFTTFSTPYGRFQYTVTAMGLKNAGTDFQKAVSACLRTTGQLMKSNLNYIDDLLVFSNDEDSHAEHSSFKRET